VDPNASLVDSSPAIRAVSSAGLDPTLPPDSISPHRAVGQTSISGAASEIMERPSRPRLLYWFGGGVLLAGGAVAIILSRDHDAVRTPAGSPETAAPSDAAVAAAAPDAAVAAAAPDAAVAVPDTAAAEIAAVPADAPPIDAPPAIKEKPALSAEQIGVVAKKRAAQVDRCLAANKASLPSSSGRIAVRITILANGTVSEAHATGALASTPAGKCVEGALATLKFPAHRDASLSVEVPFTYAFSEAPKPEPAGSGSDTTKKRDLSKEIIVVPTPSPPTP
jgi:hypothetical protein